MARSPLIPEASGIWLRRRSLRVRALSYTDVGARWHWIRRSQWRLFNFLGRRPSSLRRNEASGASATPTMNLRCRPPGIFILVPTGYSLAVLVRGRLVRSDSYVLHASPCPTTVFAFSFFFVRTSVRTETVALVQYHFFSLSLSPIFVQRFGTIGSSSGIRYFIVYLKKMPVKNNQWILLPRFSPFFFFRLCSHGNLVMYWGSGLKAIRDGTLVRAV